MDEERLNQLLDAYSVPAPSAALRDRVLADAPAPRRRPARKLFWWASGAGLAAAGVAGLVLGSTLTAADPSLDALLAEAEVYDVSPLLGEDAEGLL